MKTMRNLYSLLFVFSMLFFQGCIHEYRHGLGENPSKVEVEIQLTFNLSWSQMLHSVEFDTRSRIDKPHRFIIEASHDGEIIYRDTQTLTPDDFASGSLNHTISVPLGPNIYNLAVWYDRNEDTEKLNYNTDDLNNIFMINTSADDASAMQCGYAAANIDLREYAGRSNASVVKDLELKHAGAKFEIIATDIQTFIQEQKASLNQGDTFSIQILLEENSPYSFNSYNGSVARDITSYEYNADLWFPFAEYEELKIGEGFVFCNSTDDIAMSILIYNSARMIVSQTPTFTIPMKRGYITVVRGDFLTFPINSSLSINHIWEGEIEVEI